jgi:ABC-type sugar transport system ATPase subunit
MRTSHRIVVMRDRKKVAEFAGDVGANEIMQAIAGSEL